MRELHERHIMEESPLTGPTQLTRTVARAHIASSDAWSLTSATITSTPSMPEAGDTHTGSKLNQKPLERLYISSA